MNTKKITSILLSLILILTCLTLAGCGGSNSGTNSPPAANPSGSGSGPAAPAAPATDNNNYNLIVSVTFPSESLPGKTVQENCDMMTEKSGGRLTFDIHFSSSLLTPMDALNGVVNKIADVAYQPSSVIADYLPINYRILSLPFMGYPSDIRMLDIYDQLCSDFPEIKGEIESLGVIAAGTTFSSRFDFYFSKNVNVRTPGDIKGKKLASTTPIISILLNDMGVAPVSITSMDAYTSIDSGVTEGIVIHPNFLESTRVTELIETAVLLGDTGLLKEIAMYIMNKEVYDGLPQDLQAIVAEGFDKLARDQYMNDLNQVDMVFGKLDSQGAQIITLSAEETEAFAVLADSMKAGVIADLEKQGIKAQEIYDRARELAQK